MCKGTLFNIQRFSTADGPGIRTVVFLKGCNLRCAWCHNPESHSTRSEVLFKPELCIGCGACTLVCANHRLEGGHSFHRAACAGCGKCAQVCATNALELCGDEKTAQQVMDTVLRDIPFYEESGGGLTLSGGEPLLQYEFALELLKLAKAQGLHTAIETCGYTQQDLAALAKYVDLWLYDVKLLSEDAHRRFTGVSNGQILENLRLLDRMGAKLVLRCPILAEVNLTQAHFDGLAQLANSLQNVTAIHLEPYHPLGISKAQQLGKTQGYGQTEFLDPSALTPFAEALRAKTQVDVQIL